MRYPKDKTRLADSIRLGTLAKGKIFYEGMQAALRGATVDDTDTVHFVEVCYCLEVAYILWLWNCRHWKGILIL